MKKGKSLLLSGWLFLCSVLLIALLTGCNAAQDLQPPGWNPEQPEEAPAGEAPHPEEFPPPEAHPGEPHPEDPDWRPEEPMPGEPHPEEPLPEEPLPFEPPPAEPPPPQPEPPQPQPQQPTANVIPPTPKPQAPVNKCQSNFETDIAVTDLYADNLPHGQVHVRITNNGPCTLHNVKDSVYCFITETDLVNNQTAYGHATVSVVYNMTPGVTQTFPTGMMLDTNTFKYEVSCNLQPGGWTELNQGNNSHTEQIP